MFSAIRALESRFTQSQTQTQVDQLEEDVTIVTVGEKVIVENAVRPGINVGFHNQFGAAQILKNVITNPGFEAGEFATIFIAEQSSSARRMQADNWKTEWNDDGLKIGQPPGFWDGAEFEVVSGKAKGRAGNIQYFTHENNKYTFYLSNGGTWVAAGDAVFLRKRQPGYLGATQKYNRADSTQYRPGSLGTQSLRLLEPLKKWEWSFVYHMDSFWRDGDPTAGKLLIADGEWQLDFWVRGSSPQSVLEVSFEREGETVFFPARVQLSSGWQKISRRFKVKDGADRLGPYPPDAARPVLALKLRISEGGGWIDDIALFRTNQTNPTVFTDKYVKLLKELNPGILRNWGKQLGSTLENQLAEPFARKTTGHNPRQRVAVNFHYSLHEFLELSREVSAEPWYVIPPTFSTTDLRNLAAYLAAPANAHPAAQRRKELGQTEPWTDVFDTIHLEYGNEMWGSNIGTDQFIGATLRGGERLGSVADDRLGEFRASQFYQQTKAQFKLIIGGQASHPKRQQEIEQNSRNHNMVALAPYFGYLTTFENYKDTYGALFARAFQDVNEGIMDRAKQLISAEGHQTELAVYELNFHTTTGDVPNLIRNDFVTGLAGGLALPLYALTYQKHLNVRCQAAFTSAQYSFAISDRDGNREYVRLWGLMRDLERTGRKRPAWLGLELVNRAIRGDMVATAHSGTTNAWQQTVAQGIDRVTTVPTIHTFAFRDGDNWSLLLFNLNLTEPAKIELRLAKPPLGSAKKHVLSADSIHADNEDAENVRIQQYVLNVWQQREVVTLPPHSLTLIEWKQSSFSTFLPIVRRDQE